jgi:hypothetical protein
MAAPLLFSGITEICFLLYVGGLAPSHLELGLASGTAPGVDELFEGRLYLLNQRLIINLPRHP